MKDLIIDAMNENNAAKVIKQSKAQRMFDALKMIANDYQTPFQLKRDSEKEYGISYEEALEMSYENIQNLAKHAVKGMRRPE